MIPWTDVRSDWMAEGLFVEMCVDEGIGRGWGRGATFRLALAWPDDEEDTSNREAA